MDHVSAFHTQNEEHRRGHLKINFRSGASCDCASNRTMMALRGILLNQIISRHMYLTQCGMQKKNRASCKTYDKTSVHEDFLQHYYKLFFRTTAEQVKTRVPTPEIEETD